jgi:hypothetical protein
MINQANLTHDQQAQIESELKPGESIVWLGQPKANRFAWQTLPIVLFGIPWTAFALFWTAMAFVGTRKMKGDDAMSTGFRWFFPLFGPPFVLIGWGMLSAPFWAKRKARRTIYAITDRRAISFEGGQGTTVRSYAPDQLGELERKENRDGSGNVIIRRVSWRDGDGDSHRSWVGFFAVPNVREVEALLNALASKTGGGEDAPPKINRT